MNTLALLYGSGVLTAFAHGLYNDYKHYEIITVTNIGCSAMNALLWPILLADSIMIRCPPY